ncbi:MAG: cytochrome c peroxidase [bacterium]
MKQPPARRCPLALGPALALVLLASAAGAQGLPPVPVPLQNPITEPKRVLGKILFWEEQLSTNDLVACGTCHRPAAAGGDPRLARHPGLDGTFFTPDDVLGSLGLARTNAAGQPVSDPIFGFDPQVTSRAAPSFLTGQFAPELFWDGRAGNAFEDPETGQILIPIGGALESQSLVPILSDVEMAHEGMLWSEVTGKLGPAVPLGLASDLPADVQAALASGPSYPDLFAAAFGDPAITASRIAFAIATYERTLVPDQTPWDAFVAGNPGALTPGQQQGLGFFQNSPCSICHQPPFFTNHTFRNVGLRPVAEDVGRQGVTGLPQDRGRFKVPSLRNVGLKTRFMHNGQLVSLEDVVGFYANPARQFPDNRDPLVPVPVPPQVVPALVDFLRNGLTDPRVAAETFPFDRPTLRSENPANDAPMMVAGTSFLTVEPAFPNPLRTSTTLRYSLGRPGDVLVSIFDLQGRRIRSLVNDPQDAGGHAVSWDGRDDRGESVGSGVYFYRVATGSASESGRVVLSR